MGYLWQLRQADHASTESGRLPVQQRQSCSRQPGETWLLYNAHTDGNLHKFMFISEQKNVIYLKHPAQHLHTSVWDATGLFFPHFSIQHRRHISRCLSCFILITNSYFYLAAGFCFYDFQQKLWRIIVLKAATNDYISNWSFWWW